MGGRKKQLVVVEEGEGSEKKEKILNYPWTEQIKKFFLDLIVQRINGGLHSGGHFKNQFWNDCIAKIRNEKYLVPLLSQLNSK